MLANQFTFRNYASLAALVFIVLEYLSTCRSEYNYIWGAPPTFVKYIYLLSRYVGLIGQVVHYVLVHLFLIKGSVKPELCRHWYLFLFATCAVILAALDAVLLLRVYALYRKDVKVQILAIPIVLQFVVASVQMERVARTHKFNSYCDKPTSLRDAGLTAGSVLLAHAAIFVATFAKRNVAQAVVVRLVVHEGAYVIFILIGMVAFQGAYAIVSNSSNPFAFFVWPTAVMSVITCRMILNMNELKTEEREYQGESDSRICLSTVELGPCSEHNEA